MFLLFFGAYAPIFIAYRHLLSHAVFPACIRSAEKLERRRKISDTERDLRHARPSLYLLRCVSPLLFFAQRERSCVRSTRCCCCCPSPRLGTPSAELRVTQSVEVTVCIDRVRRLRAGFARGIRASEKKPPAAPCRPASLFRPRVSPDARNGDLWHLTVIACIDRTVRP